MKKYRIFLRVHFVHYYFTSIKTIKYDQYFINKGHLILTETAL